MNPNNCSLSPNLNSFTVPEFASIVVREAHQTGVTIIGRVAAGADQAAEPAAGSAVCAVTVTARLLSTEKKGNR